MQIHFTLDNGRLHHFKPLINTSFEIAGSSFTHVDMLQLIPFNDFPHCVPANEKSCTTNASRSKETTVLPLANRAHQPVSRVNFLFCSLH